MTNKIDQLLSNKKLKLILTASAILLVAVGATYAWWTASVKVEQEVSMGNLKISADFKELSDPVGFEPGLSAEIEGVIRNQGTIPAIIKISNSSQIEFAYLDDDFTAIQESEQKYTLDSENAIKLSFKPTTGNYEDNQDVYWFKDSVNQIYVLMEAGAKLDVSLTVEFSGAIMGNKYQDAQIKVGGLLNATQVLDDALTQEFGIVTSDLVALTNKTPQGSRSKRSISPGEARIQELISRK